MVAAEADLADRAERDGAAVFRAHDLHLLVGASHFVYGFHDAELRRSGTLRPSQRVRRAELEAVWRQEEELAAIIDGELTEVPLLEALRRGASPPPGAPVARTITFGAMARVPDGGATRLVQVRG